MAGVRLAGFRAKRPAWVAAGSVYLADRRRDRRHVADDNIDGPEDNIGYLTMLLVWGGGFVHALMIRKDYIRRLEIIDDPALQAARRRRAPHLRA